MQPYDSGIATVFYTVDLVQGQYYPLRILWGNGQAAAVFKLTITSPDGNAILGSQTVASPYFVRNNCQNTLLLFPPWGNETYLPTSLMRRTEPKLVGLKRKKAKRQKRPSIADYFESRIRKRLRKWARKRTKNRGRLRRALSQ